MTAVDQAKDLLSDERQRIKLHDFVAAEVRRVLSLTTEDHFQVSGAWSPAEFAERVARYEEITATICSVESLIGYWGTQAYHGTLVLAPRSIAGQIKPTSGVAHWAALQWYPILLLLYCGGIAATAADKYDNLRVLLQANIGDPEDPRGPTRLIRGVSKALSGTHDAFKTLPGHERHRTPRNEYLFKRLQPPLDDLLFLGTDYETYFDRFEVLLALEYAEQDARESGERVWGPIGRFGWKYHQGGNSSPLHRLISEAESEGDLWPPTRAGLFRGSIARFKEIASQYSALVAKLHWY
jgi:hypothetical protein